MAIDRDTVTPGQLPEPAPTAGPPGSIAHTYRRLVFVAATE